MLNELAEEGATSKNQLIASLPGAGVRGFVEARSARSEATSLTASPNDRLVARVL